MISDPYETNADNFLEVLQQPYEFIWHAHHGGARGFRFEDPEGNNTCIGGSTIQEIAPQIPFHLFTSCNAGSIEWTDNIMKHFVFHSSPEDKTLLAIGTAGPDWAAFVWPYGEFFPTLAANNFGEALKHRKNFLLERYPSSTSLVHAYNTLIIGDPTLKPRYGNTGIEEVVLRNEPEIISQVVYNKLELKVHEPTGLEIYDALGRLVKEIALLKQGKSAVDVSDLSEGVYFVKLSKKAGKTLDKFVVVKIVKLK